MKVKISYTVDIEDVPQIINEIITQCREDLKDCSRFKFNLLKLQQTEEEVLALQEKLARTSDQLGDCVNMAQGYVDVHKNLETEAAPAEKELLEDEDENDE